MKRIFCLLALIPAISVLFQGCIVTDHPYPAGGMADPPIFPDDECRDEVRAASAWLDLSWGAAGPLSPSVTSGHGEFWTAVDLIRNPSGPDSLRIDTYNNPIGGLNISGCPPSYLCYWMGLLDCHSACEPKLAQLERHGYLCNIGNGACDDPCIPFFPGGSPDPDPGPDFDFTKIWWLAVDETPGGAIEGLTNIRRSILQPCVECGLIKPGKRLVCHVPGGDLEAAHTISVGEPAVPGHLAHGDTLGPCPFGPFKKKKGLQIPRDNPDAPLPSAGIGFFVDQSLHRIPNGLPFTHDYGAGLAMTEEEAGMLRDIRLNHEVDEMGFALLALRAIRADTGTLELDPPVQAAVSLEWTDRGLAWKFMTDPRQEGLVEILRFAIDNTEDGEPVDFGRFRFELGGGMALEGSTIQAALPFVVMPIHDGLEQNIEDLLKYQGRAEANTKEPES